MVLSKLHTDGVFIKNEYGQVVHLTGVCIPAFVIRDMLTGWGKTAAFHIALLQQYSVRVVRLFLFYEWWTGGWAGGGKSFTAEEYKAKVDELVIGLENAGIYVWLSLEFGPDDRFQEDPAPWIAILQEWATRYKGHTNMFGIEPKNEPYIDAWPNYTSDVVDATRAIHAINPDLLVLVDTELHGWVDWSYFKDHPIPEPNIVYLYHLYYRWRYWNDFWKSYYNGDFALAKQQLEAWLIARPWKMLELGYPTIDGEFGIWGKDIGEAEPPELEPNWRIFLQDYLSLMRKHGVSWNYYCWYDSPVSYGVFEPGYNTPSPQGEVIFLNFSSIPALPSYNLIITSSPITNVPFTIRRV